MDRGEKRLSKVTAKNQLQGKEIKKGYLDEAVHGAFAGIGLSRRI
jgi:hypothetical protein